MRNTGELTLTYNGEIVLVEGHELKIKLDTYFKDNHKTIAVETFITEILGCEIPKESLQDLEYFKSSY